jgi:hypothetical protein
LTENQDTISRTTKYVLEQVVYDGTFFLLFPLRFLFPVRLECKDLLDTMPDLPVHEVLLVLQELEEIFQVRMDLLAQLELDLQLRDFKE